MSDIKETIQKEIAEVLETGLSQNKLAEQIGISAATLINIKRGNWTDISEAMIMKLKAHFKIDDWQIYSTTNFRIINDLCDEAATNSKMIAVAGYSGAGKTTALRTYAKKKSEAYYILGTAIMTQKSFLVALQRAMGVSEGVTIQEKTEQIIRRLNSGQNSLLIIDDAGKLSDNIMRLIQIIYDETEFSAGIVLAGTEYLETYIAKNAQRDKRGFRELQRRISYWQGMYRPTRKEIVTFCSDHDITDTNAISYLCESADYGTLRNMITNAKMASTKQNRKVDRSLLNDLRVGSHHYRAMVH
jgi:DNA transposition AAA+ family ATPase